MVCSQNTVICHDIESLSRTDPGSGFPDVDRLIEKVSRTGPFAPEPWIDEMLVFSSKFRIVEWAGPLDDPCHYVFGSARFLILDM